MGGDSDDLSPVAIRHRVIEPLFGLTWDDLGFCVPRSWDPPSSGGPRLVETHEKRGVHGGATTLLAAIEHTASGRPAQLALFMKQGAAGEAATHAGLERAGVATPRMIFHKGDVMVMERLSRIGIDPGSIVEGDALLPALAKLNATPAGSVPTSGTSDPTDGSANEFDAGVHWALRHVSPSEGDAWFATYLGWQPMLGSFPQATVHGELWFQQVGWADRDGGPVLVLFDWPTLRVGPRFTDVANVLGSLADASGRTEREVLRAYLGALSTEDAPDVDAAFEELQVTRLVHACWGLPWLARAHAAGDPAGAHLAGTVAELVHDIEQVGPAPTLR